MKNAVIFDLDGTLLDTLEDLKDALNHTLEEFGYQKVTLEDTRKYIGNGIRKLIIRGSGDDIDTDAKFNCFKEYYTLNCNNHTKPYDGIYELLDYLKANNYKLGVISNKAKYALDILINAHFKDYFEVVIGDGEGIKRKPDPESINVMCKRLNTNLFNIYYIGDSDTDVKTVENALCDGLFVDYGFRSKEDLIKANATKIFDSPLDLLDYFKRGCF